MLFLNDSETTKKHSGTDNSPQEKAEYHKVEENSEMEAMSEFVDETEIIKSLRCQRYQ